ncbi:MAG: molybdopterin molybdotransferase MoeA [Chloroflexia bacterium]|nr:molybdopterin molybdotransferase MoeA [Chloroflexia bacterium]
MTPSPHHPITLIGVDEARRRVLAAFSPLPMTQVPLAEALGYVLAIDVIAGANVPAFANAAMDGFAVRAADTALATRGHPTTLRVIAEAAAGYANETPVMPGTAVRIMTGAPIPPGADAVVRFEETEEGDGGTSCLAGETVQIYASVHPGENVRPIGEDVTVGETVLVRGTRVRPAEIGVLTTLNRTRATVHRRPRVGVLATGDELVDAGEPLGPGQLRNSNAPMIAAMIRRCGGEPVALGTARDTASDLRARLAGAAGLDLLLTTGGVSVGDYDLVKQVLQAEGRIEFWEVRIKPGKPLAFGWIGETPILGLPGNPVAAAVAFEQFARPAIRVMLGDRSVAIPTVTARLEGRVENRGGRRHYVRVAVEASPEGYVARIAGRQGSGVLSTLAKSNGLLVISENLHVAENGTLLPVQMLDWDLG